VYGDIQYAVKHYLRSHPLHKVLIVDLAACRGNGYAQEFLHDVRVKIFDVYGVNAIYPLHDAHLCKRIDFNFPLEVGAGSVIDDATYLGLLKRELARAVAATKPDIIFYNAGTDIMRGDSVGRMHVSREGIIDRDTLVCKIACEQAIPIVMLMPADHTVASYDIIAASLERIIALYASKNGAA
jgi:histone deacetylase 11